ncbi:hypothetical protein HRTV-28_gp15 [Halorubrum tailed virus 28]|uniref:Uncharacterized protein n=1 Tax=Halorubrum tailed virus 28 TaxID=2878009 RepID=A0AAE9BYS0_9CAUD|nr:hypothetical protein M1M39_gp16 [Halorubrum tailed virus 28]UBF23453.1 hypothetical protein HRTV-28_gp15 [Halorubrum tailed virus 28]
MTATATNVFTVAGTDLTGGEEYLVPKDLSGEADQYRPHQFDENHRAWVVKLVAGGSTDADVTLEAAVTTGDDEDFSEYAKEGTSDTATGGTVAPDSVAVVFSDEASVAGINAVLTPATTPTAGTYKVVIESRET